MRLSVPILVLLLAIGLSVAACSGSAGMYVPAVVKDGGSLIYMSLRILPGQGDVYISTHPRNAVSTQVSVEDAVTYGFTAAGQDMTDCDALLTIRGQPVADFVEGPSAGVAVSVLTYAALQNQSLLPDATVTGVVDADGNVQPVGGVYEKVRAAAQNGMHFFVMPMATVNDRVLLLPLKRQYGIQILEVRDAADAINFMTHGILPPTPEMLGDLRPIPSNLSSYSSQSLDSFRPLALKMIALENETVQQLSANDSEDIRAIRLFFLNDIRRQQVILENGYLFTAANEAFLDYIDAVTILNSDRMQSVHLDEKKRASQACLDSLEEKPKTMENMEWVVGADLRKGWAEQRLQSIDPSDAQLVEEKYFLFNQLQYADGWCFISRELIAQAPVGGSPVDESRLQGSAYANLQLLDNQNFSSPDLQEHAASARLLFEQKKYAASLYDSTFALSLQKADEQLLSLTPNQLDEHISQLLSSGGNLSSLWANVYQSQGVYLSKGGVSDKRSAYRILTYASALENLHNQILASLSSPAASPPPSSFFSSATQIPLSPSTSSSDLSASCTPVYLFGFVSLGGLFLWKRRH